MLRIPLTRASKSANSLLNLLSFGCAKLEQYKLLIHLRIMHIIISHAVISLLLRPKALRSLVLLIEDDLSVVPDEEDQS